AVSRLGTARHPHLDGSDHDLDGGGATPMRGLVRPCRFHRYHRHKGRHLIGRQRELTILGRSDPVRQMLRSEIMLPRHVRYHRARCDRLGNNPPLLLIAPPSAADNARYFRVAPNNLKMGGLPHIVAWYARSL